MIFSQEQGGDGLDHSPHKDSTIYMQIWKQQFRIKFPQDDFFLWKMFFEYFFVDIFFAFEDEDTISHHDVHFLRDKICSSEVFYFGYLDLVYLRGFEEPESWNDTVTSSIWKFVRPKISMVVCCKPPAWKFCSANSACCSSKYWVNNFSFKKERAYLY